MIQATSPSLRDFFESVYLPARLARRSPATVQAMRLTLTQVEHFSAATRPGLPPLSVAEIDEATLDGFRAWRTGVGNATLNKDLRHLRALANLAIRRRYRAEPLYVDLERERQEEPVALLPAELERLFAACAAVPGLLSPGLSNAAFWVGLIATIYSTGARIGALLACRREDFCAASGSLRLKAETQKQGRTQIITLHAETIEALRPLLAVPHEKLFPWPFKSSRRSHQTLRRRYRKILAAAGIPDDGKHQFHCLRRTCATLLAKHSGRDAATRQLDHSSAAVTRRYIDASQLNEPSARELIPPPPITAAPPLQKQLTLF